MKTTMRLKNDITEIQQLKDRMIEYGKAHHISTEIIHDIKLVLEEVVSNIIYYGYEDAQEHQIEIDVVLNQSLLVLTITDDAKPFNPLDAPEPNLDIPFEDRQIGGAGIYLMRTLMDTVKYRREQGKNVLVLSKRLPLSVTGTHHLA
jgi:anti-sigma regulatory factor (Ser/Thr protein kinase)